MNMEPSRPDLDLPRAGRGNLSENQRRKLSQGKEEGSAGDNSDYFLSKKAAKGLIKVTLPLETNVSHLLSPRVNKDPESQCRECILAETLDSSLSRTACPGQFSA